MNSHHKAYCSWLYCSTHSLVWEFWFSPNWNCSHLFARIWNHDWEKCWWHNSSWIWWMTLTCSQCAWQWSFPGSLGRLLHLTVHYLCTPQYPSPSLRTSCSSSSNPVTILQPHFPLYKSSPFLSQLNFWCANIYFTSVKYLRLNQL